MARANKLAKLLKYNKPLVHWTERDYLDGIMRYGLTTDPTKNKNVGINSFKDRSSNTTFGQSGTKLGEFKRRPLYFIADVNDVPPVHLHDPVGLQVDLPDDVAAKIKAGTHTYNQNYNIESFFPDISNMSDEELMKTFNLQPYELRRYRNIMTEPGLTDRNKMFSPSLPEVLLFEDIPMDWMSVFEIPSDMKLKYKQLLEE